MLIKIGNHRKTPQTGLKLVETNPKNTPTQGNHQNWESLPHRSTERSSAAAEGVEKSSASSQSPSVPWPRVGGYEVDDGGGGCWGTVEDGNIEIYRNVVENYQDEKI